jgi:ABC-type lipoprotein export system ATPase subunit
MDVLISYDNVHKSYRMGKEAVPALRGVTLDIAQGEFVCLMGPSGSGKTTQLNIIGGLDEPGRGHVTIEGENLVALSENKLARLRLKKMGFVFQNSYLHPPGPQPQSLRNAEPAVFHQWWNTAKPAEGGPFALRLNESSGSDPET